MKKLISLIFACLVLLIFQIHTSSTASTELKDDQVIGIVNDKKLYKKEFDRLFNAQKNIFHKKYLFDLLINHNNFPEVEKARKELLTKAKLKGLTVHIDEVEKKWEEIIKSYEGIENFTTELNKKNLSVSFVKSKLKENMLLDKYFKEESKYKLTELMVDELIVLEEAKKRNITVPEDEVNSRFDKIVEKEGGIDRFNVFLAKNQATIEDAKNEIRNKLIYKQTKESLKGDILVTDDEIQYYYKTHAKRYKNIPMELVKEQVIEDIKDERLEDTFNTFVNNKKINSDIFVFNNNFFEEETTTQPDIEPATPTASTPSVEWDKSKLLAYNQTSNPQTLRTTPYPTATKTNVEEINKLAVELEQDVSVPQPTITIAEETISKPTAIETQESQLKKEGFLKKLASFNIFKKGVLSQKKEYDGFPLPTEEQQKQLDKAIKLREEIENNTPIHFESTAPKPADIQPEELIHKPNIIPPLPGQPLHKTDVSRNTIAEDNSSRIKIIGHRGDPYRKVENTLESIYSAWAGGADAVEVDVQLTSDNQIILFHDTQPGFDGLSAGFLISANPDETRSISDYSWDELNRAIFQKEKHESQLTRHAGMPINLDLKTPARIARLNELSVPKDKKLFIELKCTNMEREYKDILSQKIADWVNSNNLTNNVTVISFDPYCLAKTKKFSPGTETGLNIFSKASTNKEILLNLKNSLEISYLLPSFKETNEELIKACSEAGLKVIPWTKNETINEEISELMRLKDLGVIGLITNQPRELKTILTTIENVEKSSQTKSTSTKPTQINETQINQLNQENNLNQKDLQNLNVFKSGHRQLNRKAPSNNSPDLSELRRKLEQRRITEDGN